MGDPIWVLDNEAIIKTLAATQELAIDVDALFALNERVIEIIRSAAKRAKADGSKIIRSQDV